MNALEKVKNKQLVYMFCLYINTVINT